jgi:Cu/Ag efflux protein CusF
MIDLTQMKTVTLYALLLAVVCINGACARRDSEPEGPAAAVQNKSYPGVGTITHFDSKMLMIEIDHEDIKGLMPAMQMQFHLKDKRLLEGLKVGDRIEFTVENGVGGMQVTAIRKL